MTKHWIRWVMFAIWGIACVHAHAAEQAFVQKLEGTDVSFRMVPILAGSFLMGSPDSEPGRNKDEGPRHRVEVQAFFIEEHEVTWAEYNLFLRNYNRLSYENPVRLPADKLADAVTFPTPMYDPRTGPELQRMGGRRPNMPAVTMSQFAARQYTKWLSKKTGRFYRLPSEAEWEYAARAGTQTAYFFGDDPSKLGDYAWYKDNSKEPDGRTGYHAIMTKKPNPWGLYDMYGNALEWCVDLYDAEAYANSVGKQDTVNWAPTTRMPYPRVLRGGAFDSEAAACRSASRIGSDRDMNGSDSSVPKSPHWMSDGWSIGFRLVAPVKEPSEAEKRKWWDADDATRLTTITRDREKKALVSQGAIER
jgi:sulfatase modifying factor 1